MNFEIITKESFKVCGLNRELTTSQNENYKIIKKHWQTFNDQLKIQKVNLGKNWVKYGITKKIDGKYWYMPAIPFNVEINGFDVEVINGGRFICFQHKGSLNLLKSTIYDIYKHVIPESNFEVDKKRTIMHYEQYDYRFNWNKTNSIVEIYLPVANA